MRKGQIKILEQAKQYNLISEQMAMLSKEDLTLDELDVLLTYFIYPKDINPKELVNEAEKWVTFLHEHRNEFPNTDAYIRVMRALLRSTWTLSDTLIGNKKKMRIYKWFLYLYRRSVKTNEEFNWDYWRAFYAYEHALYENLTEWQTSLFIRIEATDTHYIWLNNIFEKYPSILDNFLHAEKDSLLYFLYQKEIVATFQPTKDVLDSLYDYDNHCYKFSFDEFDTYFIKRIKDYRGEYEYKENFDFLTKQALKSYPFVNTIIDYCEQNGFTKDKYVKGYVTYKQSALKDPSNQDRIDAGYAALSQGFNINIDSTYSEVNISSKGFVSIIYNEYSSIYVGVDKSSKWNAVPKSVTVKRSLMIAPDGSLYRKNKSGKIYPVSMSEFMYLYKRNDLVGYFAKLVLDYWAKQNPFYKDVFQDFESAHCTMPLLFNEILQYHNRAELLRSKYKLANELHVKWNKQNMILSYMIIKAYKKVEPGKSQQILLQQKDEKILCDSVYGFKVKQNIEIFLSKLLKKLTMQSKFVKETERQINQLKKKYQKELEDELNTSMTHEEFDEWIEDRITDELQLNDLNRIIEDYLDMCHQTKVKIKLDVGSIRQLINMHDRFNENPNYYRAHTKEVSVPDDSKFNELRELLPKEFEWIKTRKRLILETEFQHHCVWRYANGITKDRCAIYSFVNSEENGTKKRYTIEFRVNKKGEYVINQVQGRYNRSNTEYIKSYIEDVLKESYENKFSLGA